MDAEAKNILMSQRLKFVFRLLTAAGILAGGFVLIVLVDGCCSFDWVLTEAWDSQHSNKATVLVKTAFRGSDSYFFVYDNYSLNAAPLRVGGPYISDSPIQLQEAVWSKDGSVVAARVKVGKSTGHGMARYDGIFWVDAYDFRKHQRVVTGKNIKARSQAISLLLSTRGGEGHLMETGSAVGRGLKPFEYWKYDVSNHSEINAYELI